MQLAVGRTVSVNITQTKVYELERKMASKTVDEFAEVRKLQAVAKQRGIWALGHPRLWALPSAARGKVRVRRSAAVVVHGAL